MAKKVETKKAAPKKAEVKKAAPRKKAEVKKASAKSDTSDYFANKKSLQDLRRNSTKKLIELRNDIPNIIEQNIFHRESNKQK